MIRLLLHNSSLLAPSYVTWEKEQGALPKELLPHYGVSFFVPLYSVEIQVASKLAEPEAGQSKSTCALPSCSKTDCKQMCS